MKVIDDKAATWTKLLDCPDCKSSIEIQASDVKYERLGSFDGPYETHYSARCAACMTNIRLPANKLPDFVKTKAKKL